MLPARIPKPAKRETRWRSPAHLKFIRSFACSNCGSMTNIEAAHVRIGSGAGLSQKPDDWRAVSLCGPNGSNAGCHATQHHLGEQTFWQGRDVEALIEAFVKVSPKRHEIEQVRKERGL